VWHLISGSTNIKFSKIVSKAYTFLSSRGFWMVLIWPIWAKIGQNLHVKNKFPASGTGAPPLPWVWNSRSNTPLIERKTYEAVCQLLGLEGPSWAKWGFLQLYSTCECTLAHCCMDHESWCDQISMWGGKGTVASGVGTVECIRHDMKHPLSVGDLQKGER